MRFCFAFASSATCVLVAGDWEWMNNTNLRHGDITAMDFYLPKGTDDAAGISACTAACASSSDCAAWVFVRSGPRCAMKGKSGFCVNDQSNPCAGCSDSTGRCNCIAALKPGTATPEKCSSPSSSPSPSPGPSDWLLPAIDWSAGGVVAPTNKYAIRAFDAVYWPDDEKWYVYSDLVLFSNPKCPSSFGSEIGVFSAESLDSAWTYHGIAASKNSSDDDAGGLATPTAIVHNGQIFLYFVYEGLPVGDGLRGIGGAKASHPLGPFVRTTPVAEAPAGWHRPTGPGGILDDPEVIFYGNRFHLFHSRKHVSDLNCSLTPDASGARVVDHCVEWRTSADGETWQRRGVLSPPSSGAAMSETMSARIYGDQLVMMTDGKGMVSFTAEAAGLLQDDAAALIWSPGVSVNGYAGLNSSFVDVALRILPVDSPNPTHAALGWRPLEKASGCHGGMTFAVFPLKSNTTADWLTI